MENLASRSHSLHAKVEEVMENKRKLDRCIMPSDSRVSKLKHVATNCLGGQVCEGRVLRKTGEVKEIYDRLEALEQEAQVMKQSLEERNKLKNEIYEQLLTVQRFLHFRNQVTGNESKGTLIFNPCKTRGTGIGLSQVLCQELNPTLVIRDLRRTMLAFEESAEVIYECSKNE